MKSTIFAVFAIAFSATQAFAVSHAVKMACRGDYFAHCSMHAVGSPGVRQCMRAVGPRLSQGCLGALANAGEIKSSKVVSKKNHLAKAQPTAKQRLANKSAGKKAGPKKVFANKAGGKTKKIAKARGKKTIVAVRVPAKTTTAYASSASKVVPEKRVAKVRHVKQKHAKTYAAAGS